MAQPAPPVTVDAVVCLYWSSDTAAGVIDKMSVAGRPTHPYPGGEGNHVTALAVFVDTLRRSLIGLTRPQAVTRLTTLLNHINTDGDRDLLPDGPRRARFVDARTRAATAIANAQTLGRPTPRMDLTAAIQAYLSVRNYAPFASGFVGAAQAIGAGERAPLRRLRRYEQAEAGSDAAQLRQAMWELLDARTLGFALTTAGTATLPGLAGTGAAQREAAVEEMITRHLREMTRAYPLAYRASGIAVADNLNALVEGADIPEVELPDAPAPVAAPDAVGRAPDGWSGGSATGALVTIEVGGGTVTAVNIASRGGTLLGGQGHHLTAHVLFERQVIAAMENKTLALARTRLLALADAIVDLPAFPPDDGGTRSLGAADPKLIFATAWENFGESLAAARAAVGAVAITETLPDLATSYLALRNALPLVAVDYGAPAGSGGEPEALRRLDGYEAGTRTRSGRHICGAMWKLLSLSNVGHVFGGAGLARLAPGAPADPVTRLVWMFATHRIAVRSLWPVSYGLSDFNTRNSLRYAIGQAGGLLLDDDQWQRLFTALQVTEDGVEPRYHLEVKAASSKLLDDEFRQSGSRKRGGKEEQSVPRTMALRTRKQVDYSDDKPDDDEVDYGDEQPNNDDGS